MDCWWQVHSVICAPPAVWVGANRRFRDPWFAVQVAGFRRASVQNKGFEKADLVRVFGWQVHSVTIPGEFKLPWREAGPPNHHDDKVDSDQQVVNKELSLCRWQVHSVTIPGDELDRRPKKLPPGTDTGLGR